MPFRFSKSLSRMHKSQKKFRRIVAKALVRLTPKTAAKRKRRPAKPTLAEVTAFGSNPGRLTMKLCVPEKKTAKPPLVVVLHGCRQTPESFDAASGFSTLARQRGFVLLYPQQNEGNNAQRCFNWFRPSAVTRDRGELMSVRQMIEYACIRNRVDRSRIFIVGLSAGGGLASALVATYPELFSGAAVVAGMPFGAARNTVAALRAMRSGVSRSHDEWGNHVREVSPARRRWPPISIWQGADDRTVNPSNAQASVSQWLAVSATRTETGRAIAKPWGTLTRWKSGSLVQVSLYSLKGFGHGFPVREVAGKKRLPSDPYVLKAAISAPLELLRIWGLKRSENIRSVAGSR